MDMPTYKWGEDISLATYDAPAEEAYRFMNYEDAQRVSLPLFDHTGCAGCSYSQKLTGQAGSLVGLSNLLHVQAGDEVAAEVYGK